MKTTKLSAVCSLVFASAVIFADVESGYGQNGSGPGTVDLAFTGHTNVSWPVTLLTARPAGGYFCVFRTFSPIGGGSWTPRKETVIALTSTVETDQTFQVYAPPTNSSYRGSIGSVLPLADGRLYISGQFPSGGNNSGLARLLSTGVLDSTFTPDFAFSASSYSAGYSLVQQTDGKILAGVSSATYNGFTKTGLVRFSGNGSIDTSFHFAGTGPDQEARAIQMLLNGKILVGGYFTTVNGVAKNGLARLNANGTLDTTFTLTVNGGVQTIIPTPGGKFVLGGTFTSIGGTSRTNLARLNADGTLDDSFVPVSMTPSNTFFSLLAQPDGKILVFGGFTNIGGFTRNSIARLIADGSLDTSFDSGSGVVDANYGASPGIYALAQQPDGKNLIGGPFFFVNGVYHNYLARLNGDGGAVVSQSTNAGNITLSVVGASGGQTYQWQLNGTNLPGATVSTLSLTKPSATNAGRYSVIVSDVTGSVTSQSSIVRFFGDLQMYAGMVIAGDLNDRYRIEAADIIPGVTNWVTVTTFTHPGGVFLYTDSNSPGRVQRYYRAILVP